MYERLETTEGLDRTTRRVDEPTREWDAQGPIDAARLLMGRYRLGERLGAGGFGTVYAAYDERLKREVAVKVVERIDGEEDERPEREAIVAARLNHPSIVALYEVGADDRAVYLVSELVDGPTLGELIREDALSDRDVARIGVALCEALAHAHQRGVIHRDVKPQNVMLVAQPAAGAGFAKLADFGVAHLADDPLTRTGDVVGTLAYMAPEQAEGARATSASDVYSLALVLYEAWTGTNPVRRRGPAATARQLGKPVPSLGRVHRRLPIEICAVIDAALSARPERRPSLEEIRDTLAELAGELSDKGALSDDELWGARPRVDALGRIAAGVAAGGLVLAALTLLGPRPPFEPLAAASCTAVAVALLPRLAWALAGASICAWLASPAGAREGTALALAVALAPIPLLLPRAPVAWSLPPAAPFMALAGAGPAFTALAGQARTFWRRTALGVIGFIWVALAEGILGGPLMYGLADGQEPVAEWRRSGWDALSHGVLPALATPAVLTAAAWGLFAGLLPVLVRGRRLAADVMAASVWAAGLVAVHAAIAELTPGYVQRPDARGVVAGAAAAGALAVLLAAVRAGRSERPVEPDPVP